MTTASPLRNSSLTLHRRGRVVSIFISRQPRHGMFSMRIHACAGASSRAATAAPPSPDASPRLGLQLGGTLGEFLVRDLLVGLRAGGIGWGDLRRGVEPQHLAA